MIKDASLAAAAPSSTIRGRFQRQLLRLANLIGISVTLASPVAIAQLACPSGEWVSATIDGKVYSAAVSSIRGESREAACAALFSYRDAQPHPDTTYTFHAVEWSNIDGVGNRPYCKIESIWTNSGTLASRTWSPIDVCVSDTTYKIELEGRDSTFAMPVGPALPIKAKVSVLEAGNRLGNPLVRIQLAGTTNNNWYPVNSAREFDFYFVPPKQQAGSFTIQAFCHLCEVPAEKTIVVEAPLSCTRNGNPIAPATGEKTQAEVDWIDSAPHPVSFVRHYSSGRLDSTGLSPGWRHSFFARLRMKSLEATVDLAESSVIFTRASLEQAWVSQGNADRLFRQSSFWVLQKADDDSRWVFDDSGRLVSVVQRNAWTYTLTYSADRLTSVGNAFGRSIQFGYDAQGRIASATFPDGGQVAYSYDPSGRLVGSTSGPDGPRHYRYDDPRWPNALTAVIDADGVRSEFVYDALARAVRTSRAGGAGSYEMSYGSSTGAVLQLGPELDPSLREAQATVTPPVGAPYVMKWQGVDGEAWVSGAGSSTSDNQVASRVVGATGLPSSEKDFLGNETTFQWDASRRLKIAQTQGAGVDTRTTQIEWHPTLRLPLSISVGGQTTSYTYDDQGNELTRSMTVGGQTRLWTSTYNSQGLLATYTEPGGGVWSSTYDSEGNRLSLVDPAQRETKWTYDSAGRVKTVTIPGRAPKTVSYYPNGLIASESEGADQVTYTYSAAGRLVGVANPDGSVETFTYDTAGRLVGTRGATAQVEYTLNSAGVWTGRTIKDLNGNIVAVHARATDGSGRITALQSGQGDVLHQYGYDANGTLISESSSRGGYFVELDSLGRPSVVHRDQPTTLKWDSLDQLKTVTDEIGVTTTYGRNGFGEDVSEQSADIGTIARDRDANGLLVKLTDAKGQVTNIERDALGRAKHLSLAGGDVVSYEYGPNGLATRIEDKSGRVDFEYDTGGRVITKVQDVNDVVGSPSRFRIAYEHDKTRLAAITYPSGLKVFYRRSNGVVTQIDVQEPSANANRPKPTVPFASSIAYSALGKMSGLQWSNGAAATRTFDHVGQLTATEFATFGIGAGGNLHTITQSLYAQGTGTVFVTPLTWEVVQDHRMRVIQMNRPGSETRFQYDDNSNRTGSVVWTTSDTDLDGDFDGYDFFKEVSQTISFEGQSNRIAGYSQTTSTTNNGRTRSTTVPVTFTRDANGSLVSDGLRTFEYDGANRPAKVSVLRDGEAAKVTYLYNALGQRVFKSEPLAERTLPDAETLGQSFIDWLRKQFGWMFTQAAANTSIGTAFVYGDGEIPAWALLGEYDNGSATGKGRTEYIWLPQPDGEVIPVGFYRNGKFFSVHSDHLGTPRLVRNEANAPVWQWPYSAFGANKPSGVLKATDNPKAAITNQPFLLKATAATELNLRFPGQYFDVETGTFQNYWRDYDPGLGGYRQADPIGLAGGMNRFSYVEASPLSFVDALGLQATDGRPPRTGPFIFDPTAAARADLARRMSRRSDDEKTYATYTRYNPLTGDCYTGRTSGYGTPEQIVRQRGLQQADLTAEGFNMPVVDRFSGNKSAIRGREQQVMDLNGGARSSGGSSRNIINGISPWNPRGPFEYIPAAIAEFGVPVSGGRCTCQ